MFEKIGKSNKLMALIAVATLSIVAYVFLIKPRMAQNTEE